MYLKLEHSVFHEIVVDILHCVPILQPAAKLDMANSDVFNNRHKVLCALEELLLQEHILLDGTIEIDETFELESQKGLRKIKRKAHKRGEPSKYRGLSHEQVCIVTTTDRNRHEIFKAVDLGKPTTNHRLENFSGKLVEKSIVYSDDAFCYDKLVETSTCTAVQLKTHKAYNKVEHINTVNCIHSMIKNQLAAFRGVASKYSNRYMSLFVFIR